MSGSVQLVGSDGVTAISASNPLPVDTDGVVDAVNYPNNSVTGVGTLITFTAAQLQGMKEIDFTFSAIGSGSVIVEITNDGGATWAGLGVWNISSTPFALSALGWTPSTTQIYATSVFGQQLRIRTVSGATGTFTMSATLKRTYSAGWATNATATGNVASAGTDAGNPVKVGGVYNSTKPTFTTGQRGDAQIGTRGALDVTLRAPDSATAIGARASGADAVSNAFSADQGSPLQAYTFGSVFNGTTWDRQYSASAANGTTGTGVPSAGAMGFDGTNYRRLSTDTTGALNLVANQTINVNNIGGAAVPTAGADAVSNSQNGIYSYGFASSFNGSTWDRNRNIAAIISAGGSTGVAAVAETGRTYGHMSSATTTTHKGSQGILRAITVNTAVANATITIYDNTAASGTVIAVITLPATVGNPFTVNYDVRFATGLTIVTSGATDITVSFL